MAAETSVRCSARSNRIVRTKYPVTCPSLRSRTSLSGRCPTPCCDENAKITTIQTSGGSQVKASRATPGILSDARGSLVDRCGGAQVDGHRQLDAKLQVVGLELGCDVAPGVARGGRDASLGSHAVQLGRRAEQVHEGGGERRR